MVSINNWEEVYGCKDSPNPPHLSRTFCNLLSRSIVVKHKPEFDQISEITGVDITAIKRLDNMSAIEHYTIIADTEEEKKKAKEKAIELKSQIENNLEKVLSTINVLIEKLSKINNLPELLIETDVDSLGNADYFSDFNKDKGQGYIGNNFGQDLRNFKELLEYAKSKGTKIVWFVYG